MASYTYNPNGLRRSKHVLLTLEQRFICSGDSMVYECELLYPANGTVYVYGINLISARNSSGTDIFYLYNAHGDVVQLVNSSGTVVKEYSYDAFGVEYDIDSDDDNPFRYCAEYFDWETGTIYLRARYYNPANGRFTQQDGWGFGNIHDPLSLNLYIYCRHNPIRYYDPSGHYVSSYGEICSDIDEMTQDPDWASNYVDVVWLRMVYTLMDDKEYRGLSAKERMARVISLLDRYTKEYFTGITSNSSTNSSSGPVAKVIDEIKETINNDDAQKVLESQNYAFYKGALVIRHSSDNLTSWQIFGVIFLNTDVNSVNTLNHEYGHYLQEKQLGSVQYIGRVAIPSVLTCGFSMYIKKVPSEVYYSLPWEYTADALGGVTRTTYRPWAEWATVGYWFDRAIIESYLN